MKARASKANESPSGSLELKLQPGEYLALAAAGLCGTIPVATWMAVVLVPLGADEGPRGGLGSSPILGVVLVAVALTVMLVLPWLVPIRVLRARQPFGARIEWNELGVSEWDGPWKRSAIAWTELQACRVTWETPRRGRPAIEEALQLMGPPPAAAITVWTERPPGVPSFRRRLCADAVGVAELRKVVEEHGIALTREPDWLLACDSDRPPHRALSIAGRFGYPLAVLGPLVVPSSYVVGVAMGVVAGALLAARAWPSLREVRAIVARGRGRARVAPSSASEAPSPYRAASAMPSDGVAAGPSVASDSAGDAARAVADRAKLRAVGIEAAVRTGCVVMVAVSTVVALLTLH